MHAGEALLPHDNTTQRPVKMANPPRRAGSEAHHSEFLDDGKDVRGRVLAWQEPRKRPAALHRQQPHRVLVCMPKATNLHPSSMEEVSKEHRRKLEMGRGGRVKAGARTSADDIHVKRLAALTRQQPRRVQRLSAQQPWAGRRQVQDRESTATGSGPIERPTALRSPAAAPGPRLRPEGHSLSPEEASGALTLAR